MKIKRTCVRHGKTEFEPINRGVFSCPHCSKATIETFACKQCEAEGKRFQPMGENPAMFNKCQNCGFSWYSGICSRQKQEKIQK